jgi:arginine-tRNA-protein transferase
MVENRKIAENSKMELKEQKLEHLTGKLASAPKGMDPTKPKQVKAKLARREKWEKKVKEGGKVVSSKKEQHEKTVEELLDITKSSSPAHKFTKRLVKSDESDPEFISSFSESLLVYQKYQMAVHGDKEDKCTGKQFRRFLCTSPLQAEAGQGSFHLQYLLDGKIVAVGVIDILPHCVSSVYLYYDPAFHFLSLGTLTSLMEISLVRELARTSPAITNYYLGFYIHNCIKMRYKGKYFPSFLCCPETYTWHPLASCIPLLDLSPYSRLDRDMASKDRDRVTDIRGVGVLHCRQATTYQVYQEMVDEQKGEDDRGEVEEYSMLVGDRLAKRMLLYRS